VQAHCEAASGLIEQVMPLDEGPASLSEIYCHVPPTPRFTQSSLFVSPDGRSIARAYHPGTLQVATLSNEVTWATWSEEITSISPVYHDVAPIQWASDGLSIWAALQERMRPRGGWAIGPVRLINIRDGITREMPVPQHPAGPLDAVQWINGNGILLAEFGTRGSSDRPERADINPTLAIVDGQNGRVLDSVTYSTLREIGGASHRYSRGFRGAHATVLSDGRVRVVTGGFGSWIVWTQGELPVPLETPYPTGRQTNLTITPDGRRVLASTLLRANGPICEHSPNCPAPTPDEGAWASLHDIRTGRTLWTISGRAEAFGPVRPAVLRADGRYALLSMPPSSSGSPDLALIFMRDGAIMQRFRGSDNFGFSARRREIWIEYGGLFVIYSVAN
jgi:hypothetical protein